MKKVEFECRVDSKWEASYELERSSVDTLYKLADLLQCKEIEGVNIDMLEATINLMHEENT